MIGTTLFGGASLGVLALAATAYRQIQSLAARFASLFIASATVEGQSAQAVQAMLWAEWKRSRLGTQRYVSYEEHVRPSSRMLLIAIERIGVDPAVYSRGWRFIVAGQRKLSMGNERGQPDDSTMMLSCIRGTVDLEEIVRRATDRTNDRRKSDRSGRFTIEHCTGRNRFPTGSPETAEQARASSLRVVPSGNSSLGDFRYLRWRPEDVGPPLPPPGVGPYTGMYLCEGAVIARDEVGRWFRSEAWYRDRMIPWTRGILLYGEPGTGKTRLIKAIAQDLDVPVFSVDLASMDNRDLLSEWGRIRSSSPCIAVFEDLDRVFNGEVNVHGDDGVTFDCLLNCLGGIESADGVLKIATTNHVERIDPALGGVGESGASTRPGRFDVAVYMGPPSAEGRRTIAEPICRDCPEDIERLVEEGAKDTGAQFTERCRSFALARHWGAIVPSLARVEKVSIPIMPDSEGYARSNGHTALVDGKLTVIYPKPLEAAHA